MVVVVVTLNERQTKVKVDVSLIFAHQIYSMLKAQKNSKMTLLNQRVFAEYMDVKEFFFKS